MNSPTVTETDSRRLLCSNVAIAGLFALLVLVRVPFFFTHHVQEDAYITWRCARNLANTGIYAFNPPERVSASTSHAYVLLTAVVVWFVGDRFVPVVLTLNTVMFVAAAFMIAGAIFHDRRRAIPLWVAVSLLPVSLLTSYAGMETSLLMLLLAIAIRGLAAVKPAGVYVSAVAIFLMPWTRPDSIAFAILLIAFATINRRRLPWVATGALCAGIIAVALFNKLYFGTVLHQTVIANSVAYAVVRTPKAIVARVAGIFFGGAGGLGEIGTFNLLATRYLAATTAPFCAVILLLVGGYLFTRYRRGSDWWIVFALAAMALVVPAIYAAGGIVFPWYLWPASLLGYTIALAAVIDWFARRSSRARAVGFTALFIGINLLAVGQFALALNWGTQEYSYRASIGRAVAAQARPNDTLFLEPAGYIPFFAGCYTWDEVGLVAPVVTDYRRKFGNNNWAFAFLRDKRPTYVVQRRPFFVTSQLDVGEQFTPEERIWFDVNYHRIMQFDYDPSAYHDSRLALRVCRMGSAIGYDVYRRVTAD